MQRWATGSPSRGATSVTASFTLDPFSLTVTRSGTGTGTAAPTSQVTTKAALVVQESWLKWDRADRTEVRDARAAQLVEHLLGAAERHDLGDQLVGRDLARLQQLDRAARLLHATERVLGDLIEIRSHERANARAALLIRERLYGGELVEPRGHRE